MNIAEILKDCPKGTKLWSPMFGELELIEVGGLLYPIKTINSESEVIEFTSEGKFLVGLEDTECVLFPSRDQRNWGEFMTDDLPEGTPCVCWNDPEDLGEIGNLSLRIYHRQGLCVSYIKIGDKYDKWKYIVPIDKFNFQDFTYDTKYNYGIERDKNWENRMD